jgi:hypothetical protein
MRAVGLTLMVMGVICGLAAFQHCWARGFVFGDVVTAGVCIGLLAAGRALLTWSKSARMS